MKEVLSTVSPALERGEYVVLCTVLKSSGSTPRGAGAHMAVFADGHTEGTVGGGAIELAVTKLAGEVASAGGSHVEHYRLTPNQVADLGMVCGGDVTVLLQTFKPSDVAMLQAMAQAMEGQENVWLAIELQGGKAVQTGFCCADRQLQFAEGTEAVQALCRSHPVLELEGEDGWYVEPIHSGAMVYVFGAGHVSRALVPILKSVNFAVTVYDPRMNLADRTWFPQADRIICGDFKEIDSHIHVTEEDYIIIMTPGHEADREVLVQALRTPATYVGCIGSRRKIATTKEYLAQHGFGEEDWARVHAPIGLPIGGETPAEIAISITAQLIEHRSKR